jgi:hypothetical protein
MIHVNLKELAWYSHESSSFIFIVHIMYVDGSFLTSCLEAFLIDFPFSFSYELKFGNNPSRNHFVIG